MTLAAKPAVASGPEPVCAEHTGRKAVGTCERCGRFVCSGCSRDGGLCQQCVRQNLEAIPSSAFRARWAVRFLGVSGAVGGVSALVSLSTLLAPDADEARDWVEMLAGVVALVCVIATPTFFLMWLHRAVRQVNGMGKGVGVTPGWAVGYWFVPFVNLVKPYKVIRDLAGALGGDSFVASLHLGVWWAALFLERSLARIETRLTLKHDSEGPAPTEAILVGIGASICLVVAAVLCIRIVREVQDRLDASRDVA